MDINCTIFVQMFHFFIAYLILRGLLFKPTVAIIETEKNQKDQLISDIQLLEAEVTSKKNEHAVSWHTFHQSIASVVPRVMQSEFCFFSSACPRLERHPLTSEQKSHLITACTHDIIQKVDHVGK